MNKKIWIFGICLVIAVGLIAQVAIGDKPPNPGKESKGKPECNDGTDNDLDGLMDYPNDPGCDSKRDRDESNCGDGVCEGGETCGNCEADCGVCPECNDGTDNDGDGATDYPADSGCDSLTDNDESNCGDGVCDGDETQENCCIDCDCPEGYVCINNHCFYVQPPECRIDTDCPEGYVCIDGRCVQPEEPPVCVMCGCEGDHNLTCTINDQICYSVSCEIAPAWGCSCDGTPCKHNCNCSGDICNCTCGNCICACYEVSTYACGVLPPI